MSDAAGGPRPERSPLGEPQGGASQTGAGAAGEPPSPPLPERGPGGEPSSDDPEIQRAVRRTVGIAAMRRIRRMVDAEQALEASNARWVRRLSIVFVVAAILVLAWMATR